LLASFFFSFLETFLSELTSLKSECNFAELSECELNKFSLIAVLFKFSNLHAKLGTNYYTEYLTYETRNNISKLNSKFKIALFPKYQTYGSPFLNRIERREKLKNSWRLNLLKKQEKYVLQTKKTLGKHKELKDTGAYASFSA